LGILAAVWIVGLPPAIVAAGGRQVSLVSSADDDFKVIDGRRPVSGHGGPDMPVWGDVFAQSRDSRSAEDVKARIDAIVKYLETIQEKR